MSHLLSTWTSCLPQPNFALFLVRSTLSRALLSVYLHRVALAIRVLRFNDALLRLSASKKLVCQPCCCHATRPDVRACKTHSSYGALICTPRHAYDTSKTPCAILRNSKRTCVNPAHSAVTARGEETSQIRFFNMLLQRPLPCCVNGPRCREVLAAVPSRLLLSCARLNSSRYTFPGLRTNLSLLSEYSF